MGGAFDNFEKFILASLTTGLNCLQAPRRDSSDQNFLPVSTIGNETVATISA
jgi:hypothetical protein